MSIHGFKKINKIPHRRRWSQKPSDSDALSPNLNASTLKVQFESSLDPVRKRGEKRERNASLSFVTLVSACSVTRSAPEPFCGHPPTTRSPPQGGRDYLARLRWTTMVPATMSYTVLLCWKKRRVMKTGKRKAMEKFLLSARTVDLREMKEKRGHTRKQRLLQIFIPDGKAKLVFS